MYLLGTSKAPCECPCGGSVPQSLGNIMKPVNREIPLFRYGIDFRSIDVVFVIRYYYHCVVTHEVVIWNLDYDPVLRE